MAEAGAALSGRAAEVVRVLAGDPREPHFAREICWATDLPGGYVAVVLARLERQGWLESEWEGIDPDAAGRPQRRAYRLSPMGRSEVARASWAWPVSPATRTPRDARRWVSSPDRLELACALRDLAADALPWPIASGTAPNGVLMSPPIPFTVSSTRSASWLTCAG